MDRLQIYINRWCEHDPLEIMESVYDVMNGALEELKKKVPSFEIVGLGITNQRETIIAWDAATGKPLYNAIVWLDIRAEKEVEELIDTYGSASHFYNKTGLLINTYFSAAKLKWMSKNLDWFDRAVAEETVRFGTIDTWIIYNLTGEFVTDITNASRTLLMDIHKEKWSTEMLSVFGLKRSLLPNILSNCSTFGTIKSDRVPEFKGIKITGCAGDQQASCVGQGIFQEFAIKCTFGTGAFILTNTGIFKALDGIIQIGTRRVISSGGLLCTPCYKLGDNAETVFALEGSIATVGAGVTWLKEMGLISDKKEISAILNECKKSKGVVFVPAFAGLFAPRWRADARACIMGMTQHTGRGHIIRAFCESIGLQFAEILTSLSRDVGARDYPYICVDGGLSKNSEIMQLISDIVNVPFGKYIYQIATLERSHDPEVTCRGAAALAGMGAGVLKTLKHVEQVIAKRDERWLPNITNEERAEIVKFWNLGVERSLMWNQ
ncbi:bifunctional Carbohydrate kinase [Babesia duncani]|uniref:glycerol kinase n=1 Tax=Babesia duncani TaxID=323732 RepID=A0AAD9UQF5_9APIC|nr:bifunctional Carbohydrate kinase [Babesia duncani]